ncbi:hypothetical protein [Nonomuraea sp. NPDC049684]|uniref:hypothetical protein n=1 Tax=unclassified Nonomuraea TaxID=2593643 RepID=UPI0037AA09DD
MVWIRPSPVKIRPTTTPSEVMIWRVVSTAWFCWARVELCGSARRSAGKAANSPGVRPHVADLRGPRLAGGGSVWRREVHRPPPVRRF